MPDRERAGAGIAGGRDGNGDGGAEVELDTAEAADGVMEADIAAAAAAMAVLDGSAVSDISEGSPQDMQVYLGMVSVFEDVMREAVRDVVLVAA